MRITWLSPGDPAQNTGGYLYNARIIERLRRRGVSIEVAPLPGRWPLPDPEDFPALALRLGSIPDNRLVVADGLCWPGLGEMAGALVHRCRVVVIVHSLLARETGLPAAESKALLAIEVASWNHLHRLVATSRMTANEIAARSSAPCVVSIPGTEKAPPAKGGDGESFTLLTIGSLVPRKGHDVLLAALNNPLLLQLPWKLRCVGGPRAPSWAKSLKESLRGSALEGRVQWLGDLSPQEVAGELHRADLVLQPARYEAFGMAVAEAVARGLPVLTGPAGVVEHLPDGAALIVDGEAPTWGSAIHWVLTDRQARRVLADRALAAAKTLPTWEDQADDWISLLAGE